MRRVGRVSFSRRLHAGRCSAWVFCLEPIACFFLYSLLCYLVYLCLNFPLLSLDLPFEFSEDN